MLASFPYPTEDTKDMIFNSLLISGITPEQSFELWHFLGAFLLMVIVLVRPEIQCVLNARILVFFGGISFALYLTHYLILHSLGDTLFVALYQSLGIDLAALIVGLVVIVTTIVISIFWKKYIDDMSVSVSRAFANYMLK